MWRTKVECAGYCLTVGACDAFYFDSSINRCTLLLSEGLYINQDETAPIGIYMKEAVVGMKRGDLLYSSLCFKIKWAESSIS